MSRLFGAMMGTVLGVFAMGSYAAFKEPAPSPSAAAELAELAVQVGRLSERVDRL